MMKSNLFVYTISVLVVVLMSGCKPDEMEVEVYTSDIQKASTNGVVELPLTVSFSILGEDKEGYLPKAIKVAKRYLNEKAEYKISKGDWGNVLVVKCTVPMGTAAALKTFLETKHRPFALTIGKSSVELKATEHIKVMNQDLKGINFMLDVDLPAKSTFFRFVGDMDKAPEITAIAVFVDKKPELTFRKKVERRESITIGFKGEAASVYSELPPQFSIKF